jgi:hypothetical protein
MKPLKTRSKPILKNVDVNWYGKIHLKILKKKTNKVDKNKKPFKYFNYVSVRHKKFDK